MPVFIFSTFGELAGHISSEIAPNGLEEITGQKHQDVLLTTAASLLNIMLSLPTTTVNAFPDWDNAELYEGGVETIVKYADKLWLFVSPTDDTGTQPGTNSAVWQEVSAVELAHFQNSDQYLDRGGPYEVSAQQLFEHINDTLLHAANSPWLFQVLSSLNNPPGSPANGDRHLIGTVPSGAWTGQAGNIATRVGSSWVFRTTANGEVVKDLSSPGNLWVKESGVWTLLKLGSGAFEQITHAAPGTVTLDLKKGAFAITATADIEMDYNATGAPGGSAEWTVDIHNTSGSPIDLTWAAGRWSVKSSVTALSYPPATIGAGQRMSWKFRQYMFGGAMLMTDFTYNVGSL